MKTIKKNQVIIFVTALMLIVAGYLNYNTNLENTPVSAEGVQNEVVNQTEEAKLVNSNTEIEENNNTSNSNTSNSIAAKEDNTIETSSKTKDEYFTTSKLGRDTMYSQMIESYQKIIDNNGISQEQKTVATEEITKINTTKNAIMIAENLIKTKGFEDVVIFVNDKSVSVILKSEQLKQEQIAQVQNIVTRELNCNIEDVHISNK
mgnify:CR=1 FL=1